MILLCAIATLFCALGLGRFALGMMLPSMGASLSLNYAQMGAISTANFVGYLLSVQACGRLSHVLTSRLLVTLGLLLVGGSMALVSFCDRFIPILLLYAITGIGSGMANLSAIGLLSNRFAQRMSGRASGLMVTGNGLGIACSGLLIPLLNLHWPDQGWRLGWLNLGMVVLILGAICALVLRNTPERQGLRPLGEGPKQLQGQPGKELAAQSPRRILLNLGSIYCLFGFSYVIYLTFIVTLMVQEYGYSEALAGNFWIALGLLSMVSGPVFGTLSDRLGGPLAMAMVFALQASAYLLAAFGSNESMLFGSMVLYGVAAFSIPAIITAMIRDRLEPVQAVKIFGYVTFIFGLGQISGPALAGWLTDHSGSFILSFLLATAATGIALILSIRLHRSRTDG